MTPRLRFPEFRAAEGWTEKILGEEGEFLSSLTGKSAQHFGVGAANYVTYMNVFSNTFTEMASLGTVDVGPDESQNALACGDVLFTVSSETPEEVGMSSVVLESSPNCYVNSFCTLFRFAAEKRPNTRFLGYLLRQPLVRKHLTELAQGSTRFNLSKSAFRSLPIAIPSSGEQQKIADCLRSLDACVAAQSRKVEALQAYKRGLMQELFPYKGEPLPRRRFPEFRGGSGWVRRSMADLLDRASKPVSVDAEILYREIGVRSHGKGIFHKQPAIGETIGNKRVFWVVANAFVVNIVFAWEQALAVTSAAEEGMIASHRFPMYLGKPGKCDVRFVKFSFLTPQGKHLLGLASPGGAGRNRTLGQAEFEKIEMIVPAKLEEQARIADCLAAIDTQITAESKKLDALKTHKNGLMQQLFPYPEEEM